MSQEKNGGKGKNKTFASKRTMNPPAGGDRKEMRRRGAAAFVFRSRVSGFLAAAGPGPPSAMATQAVAWHSGKAMSERDSRKVVHVW